MKNARRDRAFLRRRNDDLSADRRLR